MLDLIHSAALVEAGHLRRRGKWPVGRMQSDFCKGAFELCNKKVKYGSKYSCRPSCGNPPESSMHPCDQLWPRAIVNPTAMIVDFVDAQATT
jgi:hypothetical protein